jgi:hypothetical protein
MFFKDGAIGNPARPLCSRGTWRGSKNASLPGSYTLCSVAKRDMAPEEGVSGADHSGPRKRGFFRRVGLAVGRSRGALFEHTRFASLKDHQHFDRFLETFDRVLETSLGHSVVHCI